MWLPKILQNKRLVLLIAFLVNSIILGAATVFLYELDRQTFHKETNGLFGSLGIVVSLFFIPIITWINFFTLYFVGNRAIKR